MGMPHEGSMFCDFCSAFNIQVGSIIEIDRRLVCESCIERFGGKELLEQLKRIIKKELKKQEKK